MKRILYIAAAVAALAACNVTNIDKQSPAADDGTSFVKGQKVTLTVGTGIQTKVSSELVTSGEDKDKVNFKWETGDKILVKVGEATAEFTLKSGAGGATATFEGTMPADGESFDVQYPVEEPDLTTQTYSATEAIPHNMMKFTATGCTVGTAFTMTAANAALRLNLYGDACKVKRIVVTNTTSTASYTLNFDESAAISSDSNSPTPFFIVVPAGKTAWPFKAHVLGESTATMPKYPADTEPNYGSGIPIVVGSCSTNSAKTFTAGVCLNMAAFPVTTTVWAPVNCGYEPKTGDSGAALGYPFGMLYQWGRKYGQGYKDDNYEDADYPGKEGGNQFLVNISSPQTTHPDEDTYNGNFYHDSSWNISNWYGGSDPDKLWNSNEGTSNPVSKSGFDPCPEGWRVPTYNELYALIGGNESPEITAVGGQNGCYFNGTSSASSGVFLPAAGYLDCNDGGAILRGNEGNYWSSSFGDVHHAWYLYFDEGEAVMTKYYHAYGHSVRCVQE